MNTSLASSYSAGVSKTTPASASFGKFAGFSAILVGLLSIAYAVFFLFIAKQDEYIGSLGSWLILGISGLFGSAAYVGVYQRIKGANEGLALWGLVLGLGAAFATFAHGIYQALLTNLLHNNIAEAQRNVIMASRLVPSSLDPNGLATFFLSGIVALIIGLVILHGNSVPRWLGVLALINAILLVTLFAATVMGMSTLILISGGLASVVAGPIWWVGMGINLLRSESVKN